MYKRHMGFKEW
jgi:hypothetical protein